MSEMEEFTLGLVMAEEEPLVVMVPVPAAAAGAEQPIAEHVLLPAALTAGPSRARLAKLLASADQYKVEDSSSSSNVDTDDKDSDYVYEGRTRKKKKTKPAPGSRSQSRTNKKTRFDPSVLNQEFKHEVKVEANKIVNNTQALGELEDEDERPSGIQTMQESLAERRRMSEYHEVLRIVGEYGIKNYNFLTPPVRPVVLNVVASASIGVNLDLKKIITFCKNVEYNPRRFAPCVMRIRKPRSTCLIFASGRLIVSGCKSERDAYIAVRRYVRILQKHVEPKIKFIQTYEIQNMSASCTLPFGLTLQSIASAVPKVGCSQFVSYEPELFPGLVWRMSFPKARIVLFCGGAILFTGLKSEEELQKSFELIYPLCRKCRRY